MRFDWNEAKARSNKAKHGIDFETAEDLFTDPLILEDHAHSEHEQRFIAIGFDAKGRLLSVVFVKPDPEIVRIISARKATTQEADLYAQERRKRDAGL